eukprot:SAG31_NODE_449_length_15539_cov_21.936658_13_plen_126_part_00
MKEVLCDELQPLGRREEHEAECESQPVVCPFAPERCDVMFKCAQTKPAQQFSICATHSYSDDVHICDRYELDEHVETCPYRDGTPKEAAAAERRRRRTDPYELFTYMVGALPIRVIGLKVCCHIP